MPRPASSPIILIGLRLAQGLALGGEYGGAAIYVAEHAPKNMRGLYSSWIQTTATLGLFMALLLVLGIRSSQGEPTFAAWGWRIPFLLSAILLGVSSIRPVAEGFGQWLLGALAEFFHALEQRRPIGLEPTKRRPRRWWRQAARRSRSWALFFLLLTAKVPAIQAQIMIAISLLLGRPFFIVFGWLSDQIGRKPIILAGFALAVITYFPIFQGLVHFTNPKLEAALASAPVTVIADPNECSSQFHPVGVAKFTTSCDIAKSALVASSVNYKNEAAPEGTKASVKVGDQTIATGTPDFAKQLGDAITKHGYPPSAALADINYVMTVILLTIPVIYVTMVYAPIAAWLVELFPTRIRYSGLSLPYHIGKWLVRRLPAGHRVRHCGGDRQHLLRSLVSDRRRGGELRHRADLTARNQGPRHHHHVTERLGRRRRRPSFAQRPAPCAGRFASAVPAWLVAARRR